MKKILLNESEKKAIISEREKAIIANFAKTFNSIKRIDENEVNSNNVSPEAAVDKAMTAGDKLNKSGEMDALASKIASDPNLVNQLQKLITSNGVSLNEDQSSNPIDTNDIRTLALNFAKKQSGVSEEYRSPEERSYDDKPEDEGKVGMGFVGAFGGGFLGSSLSSVIIGAIPAVGSVFAGPAILGALAGIALGILAVKVYHKLKGTANNLDEMKGDGEDYEQPSRGVEYGVDPYSEKPSLFDNVAKIYITRPEFNGSIMDMVYGIYIMYKDGKQEKIRSIDNFNQKFGTNIPSTRYPDDVVSYLETNHPEVSVYLDEFDVS